MQTVHFTFMPGDSVWAILESTNGAAKIETVKGPVECIGTGIILSQNGVKYHYNVLLDQAKALVLGEDRAYTTPSEATAALESILRNQPPVSPVKPYSVQFLFDVDQEVYGLRGNGVIVGTVKFCEYTSYFSRNAALLTRVTYIVDSVEDDSKLIGFPAEDLFPTLEEAILELNNRIGEQ